MPSKWVKVLPWYYTQRRTPSRAQETRDALRREKRAQGEQADERPSYWIW